MISNVVARSTTGIVGSNPTRVMDVYLRLFCVFIVLCRLCVGLIHNFIINSEWEEVREPNHSR
jgi:hypothetical protein